LKKAPFSVREAVLFCVGSGLALSASLCSAALPKGELDSLSQNLTVLPTPQRDGNPLSLLPMVAASSPEGGELNSLSQNLTVLTAPSGREPLA